MYMSISMFKNFWNRLTPCKLLNLSSIRICINRDCTCLTPAILFLRIFAQRTFKFSFYRPRIMGRWIGAANNSKNNYLLKFIENTRISHIQCKVFIDNGRFSGAALNLLIFWCLFIFIRFLLLILKHKIWKFQEVSWC